MVRPASFGFNPETAATNHLQRGGSDVDAAADARRARAEFDALAQALRAAGVRVGVLDDTPVPARPDAVFPNNWISFHEDGTVVLYPMLAPLRRLERRPDDMREVAGALGFTARRCVDFTAHEREGRFLEGTGSLVLDHRERVAYVALSPRSDAGLAREWCVELGYEPCAFGAADAAGHPVYHTNVLLWIGRRVAGLGLDWIVPADRARVAERLAASGRQVVELSAAELDAFAGNMLQLAGRDGPVLVMSTTAERALRPRTREVLRAASPWIVADVPTIELRGGGGVRCMLAEVPC